MTTQVRATIEDLYAERGKAEIVNGEIVRFMPIGDEPARAGGSIYFSLRLYEKQVGGGRAYPDNAGFIVSLPNRDSFSPDAAWYTGRPTGMKFLEGAPVGRRDPATALHIDLRNNGRPRLSESANPSPSEEMSRQVLDELFDDVVYHQLKAWGIHIDKVGAGLGRQDGWMSSF